ncbi:MAG: hypothetical protein AB1578_21990 [Thermodesulfobacteriota bacterium]
MIDRTRAMTMRLLTFTSLFPNQAQPDFEGAKGKGKGDILYSARQGNR